VKAVTDPADRMDSSVAPKAMEEARIETLGQTTVALTGDVHLLVTFLNKTLKDDGLIFGLTRPGQGESTFTVYRVVGAKP
jgi:hypothetical protein